jgi:hypothetical protein
VCGPCAERKCNKRDTTRAVVIKSSSLAGAVDIKHRARSTCQASERAQACITSNVLVVEKDLRHSQPVSCLEHVGSLLGVSAERDVYVFPPCERASRSGSMPEHATMQRASVMTC